MGVPVGGGLWWPRYFGEPWELGYGNVEVSNLKPSKDMFFGSHLNPCRGSFSPPGAGLWEEDTPVHCARKTPARKEHQAFATRYLLGQHAAACTARGGHSIVKLKTMCNGKKSTFSKLYHQNGSNFYQIFFRSRYTWYLLHSRNW